MAATEGGLGERAGEEGLADAGGADDEHVAMGGHPLRLGE